MKRNLYYWVKNGEIYKVDMTNEEYNLAIKERKPVFKNEEIAKAYLNKDKGDSRESIINVDYDKGYSDGFADGSNNLEDALLADCIACYLVANGCASTTSGNRIFSFEEIATHFNITVDKVKELKDDITDRLYDFPQITDSEGVIVEDNEFNLMFFLNYCDVEDE